MSGSIWLIMYDIAAENEATYLDWFHNVHIPEKLARPGFTWAAHYEVITDDGTVASLNIKAGDPPARGFMALFGGKDTRTFLNPSPAQIKPNQPPLTREMMTLRIGSRSLIAAEEWRLENQASPSPSFNILRVDICDVGDNDEDYGAWTIQTLAPHLQASPGFEVTTKMLSSTSAAKHITIESSASLEGAKSSLVNDPSDEWTARVRGYQSHAKGSPVLARRIW